MRKQQNANRKDADTIMPTTNELVPNRPLSGVELKQIILNDVHQMLDRDGMLAHHIGYGRVSYTITVQLHLDNPAYPEHTSSVSSRPIARDVIARQPEMRTVETPPLAEPTSDEEIVHAMSRDRTIDSPNKARVANGMPVTVQVKEQGGRTVEKQVKYPEGSVSSEAGEVKDQDITTRTREQWKRPAKKSNQ